MNTNLLILAAGASSRMKTSKAVQDLSEEEIRIANTSSKALIQFGDKKRPVLDFLLLNAEKAGYKHIYLIVGKDSEEFKKYYGDQQENNTFGLLRISYATQNIPGGRTKPLGTADAVTQALEQYPRLQNESFSVCNCDNLYSVAALQALSATIHRNAFVAYDRDGLNYPMERISRFALAQLDKDNILIDIIEKPTEELAETYRDKHGILRVSMNLFKFDGAQFFSYLKNCGIHPVRGEKELPTAILDFCQDHPHQFRGIPFREHVPDLTSKEDITVFKKFLQDYS